ncbi:MAG: sodium:calcium antiporter [Candidatus Nealsonbacteria bacterium]|nr:sodium:calcium antiporter [Candidatus Nealsonbacteria bacterium]
MLWFNILIFIASIVLLVFSSRLLVGSLSKIAKFLGWKEFVVGFVVMASATSFPNLFVGIISAVNGVPELAFGEIVGANIFDLAFVVGLSAILSRQGLSAKSRTVQGSAVFTMLIAVLPLLLILDKSISRPDGILLVVVFVLYIFWVFGKRERFEKTYDGAVKIKARDFLKDIAIFAISLAFLLLSAQGFVYSAQFFAETFNLSLVLVGMLILGIGSSLPELFFSIQAAKKGEDWLLLGDLMGGVIIVATLVLGIIAIIAPIQIPGLANLAIARLFLAISAIGFLVCVRTHQRVTKGEAFILLLIYVVFILLEVSIR